MPTEVGYWQIGSGQGERDYSRECLGYGIAFVGEQYRKDIERIRVEDRIILRRGTAKIVAVGTATDHKGNVSGFADEENKRWLRDFDGWDLNIREPRDRYPLDPDHINGALEVFRLILPQTQR